LPHEPHGYSHDWYRSSVTNFSDPRILSDESVPSTDQPWGFYWWDKVNQEKVSKDFNAYCQMKFQPQYELDLLSFVSEPGVVLIFAAYTGDLAEKTLVAIVDYVNRATKKVIILTVNTYNSTTDTAAYFTDVLGHAFQVSTDTLAGFLRLEHHSTSVVSTTLDVPNDTNALTFGFEFLYADTETILDVIINDVSIYQVASSDNAGKGYQLIPWINIAQFAGTQIQFRLRLSNPTDGTNGVVLIDDLIIARIEASDQPVLSVSPANQNVSKDAATTIFSVSNTGTGIMPWIAAITSESSWLQIQSGVSGTNTGDITCSFSANTSTSARTGTIRVTATGATGTPKDMTVTQAGTPEQPRPVLSVSPINQLVVDHIGCQRNQFRNHQLQLHRQYQHLIPNWHHPDNSIWCIGQSGGCDGDAGQCIAVGADGKPGKSGSGINIRGGHIRCIQHGYGYDGLGVADNIRKQLAEYYIRHQWQQHRNHHLCIRCQHCDEISYGYNPGNSNRRNWRNRKSQKCDGDSGRKHKTWLKFN
jgi:hypothetical protein